MEQTRSERPASAEKDTASVNLSAGEHDAQPTPRRPFSKRILAVIWDSLDKTPEERRFIAKIDWWILSYCCIAYFVKYLDQTNVSHDDSHELLHLWWTLATLLTCSRCLMPMCPA